MLLAFLLAFCTPMPTCGNPVVPPCATPTPTLKWDRVIDTPTAVIAGYDLYSRVPGGSWGLAAILPCWIEDDEVTKHCPGVDIDYPVQRVTNVQLDVVEFCVRAWDTEGDESTACSNVEPICMPMVWSGGYYE